MSNSRLDDLLEEWEHRRAKGEHLSAKDLCNETLFFRQSLIVNEVFYNCCLEEGM